MKYFIAINMNDMPVIMTDGYTCPALFSSKEDAEKKAESNNFCIKHGYTIYEWNY